jgi:hypothetical protein
MPDIDTSATLTEEQGTEVFGKLLFPATKREGKPAAETDDTPTTPEGEDEGDEIEETDADADDQSEDETSDDDSTDDDNAEDEPEFEVPVDGKPVKVKLSELQRSYSFQAHQTRKSQEHAERVKKFEAEVEAPARAKLQEYHAKVEEVLQTLQALTPQEPDWNALREEDPDGYLLTKDAWNEHKARIQSLQQEQLQTAQALHEQFERDRAKIVETEMEALRKAIPEFADPAKAAVEQAALREYARSLNFTDDDIDSVLDHRVFVLLRKAMKYDKAQKAKPPVVAKPKTPSMKPNKPQSRNGKAAQTSELKGALAKTGDPKVATALFERLLF